MASKTVLSLRNYFILILSACIWTLQSLTSSSRDFLTLVRVPRAADCLSLAPGLGMDCLTAALALITPPAGGGRKQSLSLWGALSVLLTHTLTTARGNATFALQRAIGMAQAFHVSDSEADWGLTDCCGRRCRPKRCLILCSQKCSLRSQGWSWDLGAFTTSLCYLTSLKLSLHLSEVIIIARAPWACGSICKGSIVLLTAHPVYSSFSPIGSAQFRERRRMTVPLFPAPLGAPEGDDIYPVKTQEA